MGEVLNRFEMGYILKEDVVTNRGVMALAGDTMKLRREIDCTETFYKRVHGMGNIEEFCITMSAAVEVQPFTETIQLPEGYYENIKKV